MNETLAPDPTRSIIDRHMADLPVNVGAIARELGLLVRPDETMGREAAGKIVKENRGSPSGYVIYLNAADPPRRQRFTLAHEIAHYVLHGDLIGDGLIDDAMYRSKLGDVYERQANRMAANVLMPEALVRGLYRGGMRSLAALSDALDVSDAAVRIRLEELRLVP
jgi:uncharacterized protein DUF955